MLYSVILKNYTPIAEFSEEGEADFLEILTGLWKTNKQSVEFYVLPYQSYEFCFLQGQEYTFAGITRENTGITYNKFLQDQEKVLFFLQSLKKRFYEISSKENLTFQSTLVLKELMVISSDVKK